MCVSAPPGYDADGVVLKLDDTRQYGTLGSVGGDPKWAVAWKFPAGEAVTRVEGVELTVGRQGTVSPHTILYNKQLCDSTYLLGLRLTRVVGVELIVGRGRSVCVWRSVQ